MTCIVALRAGREVILGADSAATNGWGQQGALALEKVFQRDEMLFGCCGSIRQMNLLQYKLRIPEHDVDLKASKDAGQLLEKDTMDYLVSDFIPAVRQLFQHEGEDCPSFLLGYRERLFKVHGDYAVTEYTTEYATFGSGGEVALGSLHATQQEQYAQVSPATRVELALDAACTFNAYCRGPYTIIGMRPDADETEDATEDATETPAAASAAEGSATNEAHEEGETPEEPGGREASEDAA